ncbi:Uma2 family endonuclease [Synechocystis salina]|uniref:Uma2 family endonuclease n=1 Tax=Synechocystis salina LEGE 00031 TaxID=1828736 RepID=A0ABR9VV15_9SYNC|nr:Uma2 family endonuclease [Synechocystis salina]MBE9241018.1 Uma2 family endonuclease [Synechocystis salina LEGE 00041]MBE9254076.1 Uma2 family endonuclease [Synechocystis salina LEGE 00031]
MTVARQREIVYPDSDGKPMADNTKQFRWIVLVKENLEYLFIDHESVFIAGDLLWYPVEGRPDICVATDVLVAFGRPKGDRGSYRQWQEDQIAPQVVFEILSPGNTTKEMSRKLLFYNHYGVEEYYIYDPDSNELTGLERREPQLTPIEVMDGWISPRLGIRFELKPSTLNLYDRQGNIFLNPVQLRQKAEQEAQRAQKEKSRADRLAAKLRELGVDPDGIN